MLEGAAALTNSKELSGSLWWFYVLGLSARFAFFSKDEAAGIRCVGSICCHSSRGRSQAFGFQITAEQICCGGPRPDPTVQHLQRRLKVRRLKVRRHWSYRLGPFQVS